jgi:hypothetical protein
MTDDGRSRHIRFGVWSSRSFFVLLLLAAHLGCREYEVNTKLDESQIRAEIKRLTGCTLPEVAYDLRGFSRDLQGHYVFAAFRIPPETSQDLVASFQAEAVLEENPLSFMARFIAALEYQERIDVRAFDVALLKALKRGDLQVTGAVERVTCMKLASSYRYWQAMVFKERGLVYLMAAFSPH